MAPRIRATTPPPPGGPSFRMGVPSLHVEGPPGGAGPTAAEYIGTQRTIRGKPVAWELPTDNEYLVRYAQGVRNGQEPTLPKRGLIRSPEGQKAAIDEALLLLDDVASYPDPDYRAAEPEHLQKALTQTGFCPGWQFIEGGLSRATEASEGLEDCVPYFLAYLRAGARVTSLFTGLSYPRGKQKGYPFFSKDDAALLPCAAMAALCQTHEDAVEVGYYVSQRLGDRSLLSLQPWAIQFSRTGPIRKSQPYFSYPDGPGSMMRMTAMTAGAFCRRRHVNAQMTYTNMAVRANAVAFKHYLRGTASFANLTRDQLATILWKERRKGNRIVSDDLSGYDKSVSRRHQLALYRVWRELAPDKGSMPLYEWAALDMGVVAPGWRDGDGAVIVYEKDAGIASGHVGTSADGSGINWMRTLKSVAYAMGWTVARAYSELESTWRAWFWGDDTLLSVPPGFDEDRYTEMNDRLGLVSKISPAPVFLMTVYPQNGKPSNLAARTYAQSIWREHEQLHESIGVFGLWVRFSLLRGHPLEARTWMGVKRAAARDGVLASRGIGSLMDLEAHVKSKPFLEELRADLDADPAGAALTIDALTRGSGDARDNPDARYAFALLGYEQLTERNWTPPGRLGVSTETRETRLRLLDEALDGYMKLLDRTRLDYSRRFAGNGEAPEAPDEVIDELEFYNE